MAKSMYPVLLPGRFLLLIAGPEDCQIKRLLLFNVIVGQTVRRGRANCNKRGLRGLRFDEGAFFITTI